MQRASRPHPGRSVVLSLLAALPLGGCAYESLPPVDDSTVKEADIASRFVVRGTLRGLHGVGLVLQNNGGDDIGVGVDGSFAFPGLLAEGQSYEVAVSLQPRSPVERCAVDGATGIVSAAGDTEVAVTCTLGEFAVGGRVHGLDAVGLVLANNSDEEIALAKDGAFVFFRNVALAAPYEVTITQQPEGTTCTITHGRGTMGAGRELEIDVACAPSSMPQGEWR